MVRLITNPLISHGIIPVPAGLPAIAAPLVSGNPMAALSADAGGLRGNWLPAIIFLIVVFINVVGEEFWWRGVVLPRQEAAFGQWAWFVHGTLWAFFHVFKWWDVLNLLPITLALSLVCSRLRNTTPGIVLHSVINGSAIIPLVLAILGVI